MAKLRVFPFKSHVCFGLKLKLQGFILFLFSPKKQAVKLKPCWILPNQLCSMISQSEKRKMSQQLFEAIGRPGKRTRCCRDTRENQKIMNQNRIELISLLLSINRLWMAYNGLWELPGFWYNQVTGGFLWLRALREVSV